LIKKDDYGGKRGIRSMKELFLTFTDRRGTGLKRTGEWRGKRLGNRKS
jgi:hypothetical protein